ncbi:MAG TPA: radical SAM family heme chaperone HemW [Steroidobacteraceae bacterium]|nr:radical SAM family heme chaperone HemW [Steroidobacteraceae bacterium]
MSGPLPPLALYVHMPWCVRKCPYCDFNSHALKSARPDPAYIDALLLDFESEMPLFAGREIETVFFGGGTPSLFGPEEYARLLQALRRRAEFATDAEITLEANPGTIERGRFAGYRDAGINRVSLGAQTFSEQGLVALGRIHTADETLRAVGELRAAKLENFNLDLMYALPNQSVEESLRDVAAACALKPRHISHYQLTLEPGTPFHARPPVLPDDDSAWLMQTECQRQLARAGYRQYEVSAYAEDGARCRHNVNYWQFGDYLGIGAGAHGKISVELPQRILRTVKPRQPSAYLQAVGGAAGPVGERSWVATEQLPFEFMLNALRLNEGFHSDDFAARTGLELACIEPALRRAERRGLLEPKGASWRPSALGRRFLNDLQGDFLA